MVKTIIATAMLLLIPLNLAHASREYTLIIHLHDSNIEFKKFISEFDYSIPTELNIFPKEIYTTQIKDKKLHVLRADPKRSDTMGLFYVVQQNNKYKGLDYIYDPFNDTVKEIILFDLDNDSIDEVITLWQGEESYIVRVDKFNSNLERLNIFNSARLINPFFQGYKRKMLVHKNNLFLVYSYQYHGGAVNKKAVLTINEDDPSGELFLKPLGVIKKSQWLSLQKEN